MKKDESPYECLNVFSNKIKVYQTSVIWCDTENAELFTHQDCCWAGNIAQMGRVLA
jgi:hypothetical protein